MNFYKNIHRMSNACASSFGRYIKWLLYCAVYEKTFYFLFKLVFLRKKVDLKKIEAHFPKPPLEKTNFLLSTNSPEFRLLFSP